MQILLRKLKTNHEPILKEEQVKLAGMENEDPDLLELGPLTVQVTAWKDQEVFHVQGKQSAEGVFRCSRCLTTFSQPMTMEWHEMFSEHRVDMDSKEEEVEIHSISNDLSLDLTPFIREAVLLHLPLAPICQEDCKGLCPECGINRNKQDCQCRRERIDPRMAKLEKLLKRKD